MQTKKYLVTNNSEGSICVTGRTRIDIPGMCKDLVLTLPENTARQTISRLKQRYPLLKIREAQENTASTDTSAQPASAGANGDKGTDGSKSDTGQNSASSEASSNNGQSSSSTGATNSAVGDDKNGSQTPSSQNQTPTQKPDNKKGK